MKIYQTVLVDDHKIFRKGLKSYLDTLQNVKVVAELSNGKELIDFLMRYPADIVFMDIRMPEMDGIEATKEALRLKSDINIVALTMFADQDYFFSMLEAGATGFLQKDADFVEIKKAIDKIQDGEEYFDPKLVREYAKINKSEQSNKREILRNQVRLTKRERDVLDLICSGYSNSEIAQKLFISERTVHGHRANLIHKTGSKNSISLVIYAIKNKLVEI